MRLTVERWLEKRGFMFLYFTCKMVLCLNVNMFNAGKSDATVVAQVLEFSSKVQSLWKGMGNLGMPVAPIKHEREKTILAKDPRCCRENKQKLIHFISFGTDGGKMKNFADCLN